MLISLLEVGNTIDGVSIANKILDAQDLHLKKWFSCFFNWKERKCHGCMEPILDCGKAVTCVNLIKVERPCHKVYCQNCIIVFMDECTQHLGPNQPSSSTVVQQVQQERECKKYKHKLWLKAY